ncbi:MAG: GNAT family N-acetyltransferase [Olsenella sp.]|jgi:putative acetyltransferase|nr:GNAT family N-acetyltransferase [Olsenella sp.]MCI1289148.1 GNAT family N-acetyltransferase [Olsenella sp.]
MDIVDIRDRTPELIEELLGVWERSVRATHDFLTEDDLARIRGYVPQAIASVGRLAVARAEVGRALGFAGADGGMLQMLFVDADARGTGVGSALLRHAMADWGVSELTVNEQNPQAVSFYEHMGFVTFGRSETDDAGEPFPLLHMRMTR